MAKNNSAMGPSSPQNNSAAPWVECFKDLWISPSTKKEEVDSPKKIQERVGSGMVFEVQIFFSQPFWVQTLGPFWCTTSAKGVSTER